MFTTKVEAVIKAPIEKVFSYVRNLETMPEYNDFLKTAIWQDADKTNCTIRLNLSVLDIHADYKITEFVDKQRFVAKCSTSTVAFEDIYEFETRGKETFLRITDNLELKGILKFSEGFLRGIFGNEMHGNMERLVRNLER
ncbi:MAG: SRPBCC family protein [Leptospiraceae bacterium]|nr:SRPBCC family protein [Leptospiraceae bacterium]